MPNFIRSDRMKVMLVNGSPHEKANTNEALKIVEKA